MSGNHKTPLVTILCVTYNQEDYLEEALDSFIMQKTKFAFEIIVHDDASTDSTQEIILKYASEYPDIIKPIFEKNNQFSQKNYSFVKDMFEQAKGKYIAECEGDDFWTDENKLQKQVDYMDNNPNSSISFHPVKVFFEADNSKDHIYPNPDDKREFNIERLLRENFIQSNSVMYKKVDYEELNTDVMPMDWYTHIYHARHGKIGFINEVMSAYRRHDAGVWWAENRDEFWEKNGASHLNMYSEVLKLLEDRADLQDILYKTAGEAFLAMSKIYKPTLLQDVLERFPDMATRSFSIVGLENDRLQKKSVAQAEQVALLSEQVANLDKNGRMQQEVIDEQNIIIEKLNHDNQQIINSKGWQAYTKARNVKSRLKGNHNKNG